MRSTKPPAPARAEKTTKPRSVNRTGASLRAPAAPSPAADVRIERCEVDLASTKRTVAALMNELAAARADIAMLRSELGEIGSRVRRMPPPLPAEHEEVISVDEREVLLESVRPPPPTGRSSGA